MFRTQKPCYSGHGNPVVQDAETLLFRTQKPCYSGHRNSAVQDRKKCPLPCSPCCLLWFHYNHIVGHRLGRNAAASGSGLHPSPGNNFIISCSLLCAFPRAPISTTFPDTRNRAQISPRGLRAFPAQGKGQ